MSFTGTAARANTFTGTAARANIFTGTVAQANIVTGTVVRAAREAAYSPDFAGVTRYEWTAEDLGTNYADAAGVSSWLDVSQGIDLTQATSSRQPQYNETDAGFPSVTFDGADDVLIGDSSTIDTSSGLTVFLVGRLETFITFGGWVSLDEGAGGTSVEYELYSNSSSASNHNVASAANRDTTLRGFSSGAGVFVVGTDFLLTVEMVDGLTAGRDMYDGRTDVVASGFGTGSLQPAATHTRMRMGVGFNNVEGNCTIRALVMYTGGALTTTQRASVWTSLENRFGGPF